MLNVGLNPSTVSEFYLGDNGISVFLRDDLYHGSPGQSNFVCHVQEDKMSDL